jgi:lariat debranching enzyme
MQQTLLSRLLTTPALRTFASSPVSARRAQRRRRMDASLRLAVVGCAHGELDAVYAAVAEAAAAADGDRPVDLVVCAGDFQAVRNEDDLECMAVSDKFKDMRSFWKYYSGETVAPVPTVFVGGNHEASNHLQELPLGGLVAPNIYYLGNAGVLNFRGLRIAGISGVYTAHNYARPRAEAPPYAGSSLKSVYHTRKVDIDRLARLSRPIDIFLSHDWPQAISAYGDQDALLRAKPFLAAEIADGRFGNPGTRALLEKLRPRYWFAAHIHVKFAALVSHSGTDATTRFLALDKVMPRRDFVQIVDIRPAPGAQPFSGPSPSPIFNLDPEWLAILQQCTLLSAAGAHPVSDEDCSAAREAVFRADLRMSVQSPKDFQRTARVYSPTSHHRGSRPPSVHVQSGNIRLAAALGVDLHDLAGFVAGAGAIPALPSGFTPRRPTLCAAGFDNLSGTPVGVNSDNAEGRVASDLEVGFAACTSIHRYSPQHSENTKPESCEESPKRPRLED